MFECRTCHDEFVLVPGKPGYANECEDCTRERARVNPVLAREWEEYVERFETRVRKVRGVAATTAEEEFTFGRRYVKDTEPRASRPKDRRR